jgi:glycosyltransferase involved in cell wall biosynthesis
MKILRIITRMNIGGPARQVAFLDEHLEELGYTTSLAIGRVSGDEGDMTYLLDKPYSITPIIPDLQREISPWKDLKALYYLSKIVWRFKPDIIHTHTAKAGFIGRMAGIIYNVLTLRSNVNNPYVKIRLVHTFHGHVFNNYFGRIKTWLYVVIERLLAKFTDKIIVISQSQKEDIYNRYRICDISKIMMIPLGFDLDELLRMPIRTLDKEALNVSIVGRLTPIKNHKMFFDAVRYIKHQGESAIGSFDFHVVGDGELRWELREYVDDPRIGRWYIDFRDWIADMPAFYDDQDIIVSTSLNEGTSAVLIEAMAAGIPVIATAVGGSVDLLGKVVGTINRFDVTERGILVPSGDSESLAKAILFIKDNPDRARLRAIQARRYVKSFTFENLLKNIDKLYRWLTRNFSE